MSKLTPFAILLRATRNGFHYSRDLGAYVRIRWIDDTEELVQVEVCPSQRIHNVTSGTGGRGHKRKLEYIAWDDDPSRGSETISMLRIPKGPYTRYESFTCDMNGDVVNSY